MHIIYDIKSKIASELAGFRFDSSSWQLNLSTAQNVFSKFRPGWWQFCWMTCVEFNSIQSILVRFLHITQFTVYAAKNLTVFVADSPRCLERSSMVAAVSRALRELSEPCLGWTREPRRQPKSLGARRQYSQATANNVLPVMTGSPAFLTRPPPANWCSLIDKYFKHKTPCGMRKLTAAFVSKIQVFSRFSWSLDFGAKMAEFPLPVLQIWRSRKWVAIQIQLLNIHVSECKYYCLHLVPKFGDMCDRQNWRLHPTDAGRLILTRASASSPGPAAWVASCVNSCSSAYNKNDWISSWIWYISAHNIQTMSRKFARQTFFNKKNFPKPQIQVNQNKQRVSRELPVWLKTGLFPCK